MTEKPLTQGQTDDLERLVDRHGMNNVLDALVQICAGKAEHVAAMWQDGPRAKQWDRVAGKISGASAAAEGL